MMKTQNWKSAYVKWYRHLESVFGNYVPQLEDKEILEYVSERNWMIIPVQGESDKKDSRLAQRPNLWFSLSEKDLIDFGIVYDKLESVERLRNIIAPYNEYERNEIINRLAVLDDSFLTKVHQKIKTHHWSETPYYKVAFKQKSDLMDYDQFAKAFDAVDKILHERDLLDSGKKYKLAPSIDLVSGKIQRNESKFTEVLAKIKPTYEFAVSLRTEFEFEKETAIRESRRKKEKQEALQRYVKELKNKLRQNIISAEDYRRLVMEYSKTNVD
jgi:hypothetical protein